MPQDKRNITYIITLMVYLTEKNFHLDISLYIRVEYRIFFSSSFYAVIALHD